jgi:hypothetical protein
VEILSVTGIASLVNTLLTIVLIVAVICTVGLLLRGRMRARRRGTVIVTELTATGAMKDAGFGTAATEALKVRLEDLGSEDVVRVDLATGASGGLMLPAPVTTQLSQASLLTAILSLIDMVLPPKEWILKGHLEPEVRGSVAISLTLMEGRRVARATSLRESDFSLRDGTPPEVVDARSPGNDYERYDRLITPAAVWLYYQTRDFVRPEGSASPRRGRSSGDPPTKQTPAPFGVVSWQSYALTAAGAELQAADGARAARTLYARALGLEPKNRMALFNLGVLDIRDGTRHTHERRLIERGRQRFERVRELSEEPGPANARTAAGERMRITHDGIWCRATYNLALANILMGDQGNLDQAACVTEELVSRLTAIRRDDHISGESDHETYRTEMKPFAAHLEPQVLILAAGLLYLHPDARLTTALGRSLEGPVGDDVVDAVIRHVRARGLNYRGHYNLAAYYARRGDHEADAGKQAEWYRFALDELEASFEAATDDLKAWGQDDPSFEGLRGYDDAEGAVRRMFSRRPRAEPSPAAPKPVRRASRSRVS